MIDFKEEHLQQMTLLPDERDIILGSVGKLQCLVEDSLLYGNHAAFCGTAYWGDEILCIGGWFALTPYICQLFIIPDANMLKKHPSVFARTTIKWRKKVEDFNRYVRIIAVALPGLADWMQVIGFKFERVRENYNDTGKDYGLWSKVL